jgi:hypothetical protein
MAVSVGGCDHGIFSGSDGINKQKSMALTALSRIVNDFVVASSQPVYCV